MNFDEYFDENFIVYMGDVLAVTPSVTNGWRATQIDKDDLKDLWDAAVASTKGE